MNSITLSLMVLACILGGIALGVLLRRILPEYHLTGDAKDVVRLGTGLIGTLAALVLGLLVASAKNSYDTQSAQIRQMTANIILLDLTLAEYGVETHEIRDSIRQGVIALIGRVWHGAASQSPTPFRATRVSELAYTKIYELSPKNDVQRALQARALQASADLAQTRLLLFTQSNDAIPLPFLAILALWLTIIFASFSLFAHPTTTVICALVIFAVSATGAIYLIIELYQPFSGLLKISSEPLSNALLPLDR